MTNKRKMISCLLAAVMLFSGCASNATRDNNQTSIETSSVVTTVTTTTAITEESMTETSSVAETVGSITEEPTVSSKTEDSSGPKTETVTTKTDTEPTVNNVKKTSGTKYFDRDFVNGEVIISETSGLKIYYPEYSGTYTVYGASNHNVVGCGIDPDYPMYDDKIYTNTPNVKYVEMYFGESATIEDNRYLTIKSYRNISNVTYKSISVINSNNEYYKNLNIETQDSGRLVAEIDLYDDFFVNDLYALNMQFEYNGITYSCNLYLLVNCKTDNPDDYEFYICKLNHVYNIENKDTGSVSRNKKINELIKNAGITPENRLSSAVKYPNEAVNMTGGKYDTNFWINKSHEILDGWENKSNAVKALLLHDWMVENLIYDDYKVDVLTQARYYNDYVSGKYYVSQINIGVCRDFVNIYAIMCRENGIPCIALANTAYGHTWSAVYLYDRWVEIDITQNITRHAYTASTTDVTPATEGNIRNYEYYCTSITNLPMPDDNVDYYIHM